MELTTLEIVALAVALGVVIAAVVSLVRWERRRTRTRLRRREDRHASPVDQGAAQARRAERRSAEREARRAELAIRSLGPGERSAYRGRFAAIEASFVDGPEGAVRCADVLLDAVAEARGYPEVPAERRLEDLALDHAAAVERYLTTRPRVRPEGGSDATEQYRQALLGSRTLFEALVGRDEEAEAAPLRFGEIIGEGRPATRRRRRDPVHTRR
ncbi:MAG: hypothetical protein WEB09_01075 [Nitriliruptor sp.]